MKALLIISCMLLGALANGQPIKKLYVYSQESTPGMVPTENGGSGKHTRTDHFIYVTQPMIGSPVRFDRIRIETNWYRIKAVDTMGTPVYLQQPEKKLLVAQTETLVLRLELGELFFSNVAMTPIKKPVMLYYIYNGKVYTISVAKMVKLDPVHGL